jgi:hypothetical protein
MKSTMLVAFAAACLAVAASAAAQQGQGVMVSREEAQALLEKIKGPCAAGPTKNKACGVMVYVPEDCAKEKDPHARKIYNVYDDGTVRFEAGTQVMRQRPGALLAGMGIFNKKGETTRYINPTFLSWEAYQAGQKTIPSCGKDGRITVKDFEIPKAVEAFLKANP